MNPSNLNKEFLKRVIGDPMVRQTVTREDLLWFWHVYVIPNLPKFYGVAPFQIEIMDILQNAANKFFVLEGFRGSSKSSIANHAFTVWSIVGKPQTKFIIIIAGTAELARQHLNNIKALMASEPLRSDMGPFQIPEGEWRANAIDIPKYNARVISVSVEQNVRGLLHNNIRPQIVILDDLENINTALSEDVRHRTYQTFNSDIRPVGDLDTRFIVIGTRLWEESLIMRFKNDIENGRRNGIFRSYPIINERDEPLWPDKFPTKEDVEQLRKDIGDEAAWAREFMLQIVADENAVVLAEWMQRYDKFPSSDEFRYAATGIDVAIRKGEDNDFNSMVSASIYGSGEQLKIYIHPDPVNEKMEFPETVERAKQVSVTQGRGGRSKLIVEGVGYQSALTQELNRQRYTAVEYKPHGTDKRARLSLTTPLIRDGTVLFPFSGTELLERQMCAFPYSKHDDMVDAFTALVLKVMEDESAGGYITIPRGPHTPLPQGPTTTADVDKEIIAKQEIPRSGYDPAAILKARIERSMERYQGPKELDADVDVQMRKDIAEGMDPNKAYNKAWDEQFKRHRKKFWDDDARGQL